MNLPGLADCCGARMATWIDDGGCYLDFCRDCGADLCSSCAGSFETDGGYGYDGSQVRTFARCTDCLKGGAVEAGDVR